MNDLTVFVVVTGLALAQPNGSNDGVQIDFPATKGFLVPGDEALKNAGAVWSEDHTFQVQIWTTAPAVLACAPPCKSTIALPKTMVLPNERAIDFEAAKEFPNLNALQHDAGDNRPGCRATDELSECEAVTKTGPSRRLLGARSTLLGKWKLVAFYQNDAGVYEYDKTRWPEVGFRTPTLNFEDSVYDLFKPSHLANTLVFVGTLKDLHELRVEMNGTAYKFGNKYLAPEAVCRTYDQNTTKCIVIEFMNHRDCDDCTTPKWAEDSDIHFLQIYRLLDTYSWRRDAFDVPVMMPYIHSPKSAASSPRCYPAVKLR